MEDAKHVRLDTDGANEAARRTDETCSKPPDLRIDPINEDPSPP